MKIHYFLSLPFFILTFSVSSFAETFRAGYISQTLKSEILETLSSVKNEVPNDQLTALETKQCAKAYAKLFSKDQFKMSVYFGYGDMEKSDYTTDLDERRFFESFLTMECREGISLCGFEKTKSKTKPNTYSKKIQLNQRTVDFQIALYHSSLTEIEKINRSTEKKQQHNLSRHLQLKYIESLINDDAVMYFGHARRGSGPGFFPLDEKSWLWLKTYSTTPFLNEINKSLQKSKKSAALIGMINCDGEGHYGKYLNQYAKKSSLFLTRQTTEGGDALRTLVIGVDGLLSESCEPQMNALLKKSVAYVFYDAKEKPPKSISKVQPKFFKFYDADKIYGETYWQGILKIVTENETVMLASELEP